MWTDAKPTTRVKLGDVPCRVALKGKTKNCTFEHVQITFSRDAVKQCKFDKGGRFKVAIGDDGTDAEGKVLIAPDRNGLFAIRIAPRGTGYFKLQQWPDVPESMAPAAAEFEVTKDGVVVTMPWERLDDGED